MSSDSQTDHRLKISAEVEKAFKHHPNAKYWKMLDDDEQVRRWHQNVARGSEITADVYLRRLGSFCHIHKFTPRSIIDLNYIQVEGLLLDLVTGMEKQGYFGSYIESNVKAIKSWAKFNNVNVRDSVIKIKNADDAPTLSKERSPTLEELDRVFMSATSQQRVECSLVSGSALRPEVEGNYRGADGLTIADLPEMEIRK